MKSRILILGLVISLLTAGLSYADDLSFDDESSSSTTVDTSISAPEAPSSEEVEYEYVPPKIETRGEKEGGAAKWESMYSGMATYSPTIKINKTEFFDTPSFYMEDEGVVFETSKVFFTDELGIKHDLDVKTQNEKVRFTNEKLIYENIYKILEDENEEIWWMDAGDKCILSYEGKLLISYANGEKSYEVVSNSFATFGKGFVSFEKI